MKNELSILELREKYKNIEEKIPNIWPNYESVGIELAQDILYHWDITDPILYRTISLVSSYCPGLQITQHLDPRFSFMGLYPHIMKKFDVSGNEIKPS